MPGYEAPPPGVKGACVHCVWAAVDVESGTVMCWSPQVCERTFSPVRGWSTAAVKAVLARDEQGKCGPEGKYFERVSREARDI